MAESGHQQMVDRSRRQDNAQTTVAKFVRGRQAKKSFQEKKAAQVKLASQVRRRQAQKPFQAKIAAVRTVQRYKRAATTRRRVGAMAAGRKVENQQHKDLLSSQLDDANQDREVRDQVADAGAYATEISDYRDAIGDYQGLKAAEGIYAEQGVSDHAGLLREHGVSSTDELPEGVWSEDAATKGEWGQAPGDADAGYDGNVGVAGAVAEGLEMFANAKDGLGARRKIKKLTNQRGAAADGSEGAHQLDSQLKAAKDTRAMAARRGGAAAMGVLMKGAEGIQHYAMSGTSADPIGVSMGSELVAAADEGVRAKAAFRRARELKSVAGDVKPREIRDSDTKARFESLTAAKKRIDSGRPEPGDWETVHKLLGRSEGERALATPETRKIQNDMHERLLEHRIKGIHGSETSRQNIKGGMAGVATAGHVTSAVGSITGGADLGAIKVAGTTTTAAVGTARSLFDVSERFRDYRRLGHAKNYADARSDTGPNKKKKRGAMWAAGHMLGDVGNVARSNVATLGGFRGTAPSAWRAAHGHRTMEESGEHLRQVVLGQSPEAQDKYKSTQHRGGDVGASGAREALRGAQLSQTQGKIVVDLASRQNRLNAATLVDAAGHRTGSGHAQQAAQKVLGALDVGMKENETWGAKSDGTVDEDTRKANIEAFMQRHALRR
jgi:hypothetical protein